MGKGYKELIADVFNGKAIHQYCTLHVTTPANELAGI